MPPHRVLVTGNASRFPRREGRASFARALPPRTRRAALKTGPEQLANARMLAGKISSGSELLWFVLITAFPTICRPFVLLVGTSLALLIFFAGSIGLLYKVGESALPSTLTTSAGGPPKRDYGDRAHETVGFLESSGRRTTQPTNLT